MTLPFRRRHHDDETAHDRARALASQEMVEPLRDDESAWLARHLEACSDCGREREAFLADRELLRSLRDRTPEPPRDLWAKTAAALDRESRRRPPAASDGGRRGTPGWRGLPLGAAAGALIVLVLIGTAFLPRPQAPSSTPLGSQAAVVVTPVPAPTPITIVSSPIGFVRTAADGSVELVFGDVDAVCPASEPECGPLIDEGPARPVKIGARPSTMTMSPGADQLVVEPAGETGSSGHILVVPVPAASPATTPVPTTAPTTVPETAVPETPEPATGEPSTVPASLEPTPEPTPPGQIEIANGVTIVGDLEYSADGTWLAFSARPIDGSTGPDLYLWSVGEPMATAVTTDHQTYFSAWLDNQVLASRVVVAAVPGASGEPTESAEPTAPSETAAADATEAPSGEPNSSAAPGGEPIVGHPVSFLLDPATLTRIDLEQPDVWLPVVDPSGRFATYWSGTLQSPDGADWALGPGQLVLDGWSSGGGAPTDPLATPGATPDAESSGDPSATAEPVLGPTGAGTPVVTGPTAAFRTRFDPEGTRLAVWVAEQAGDAEGRLHLLVIDAATGAIDPEQSPLPGVLALSGFSIDEGRLAWVSPSGQDGQQSAVKVLGWSKSEFGEIQTRAATDLYIVR
jgi:hypothetical protein